MFNHRDRDASYFIITFNLIIKPLKKKNPSMISHGWIPKNYFEPLDVLDWILTIHFNRFYLSFCYNSYRCEYPIKLFDTIV